MKTFQFVALILSVGMSIPYAEAQVSRLDKRFNTNKSKPVQKTTSRTTQKRTTPTKPVRVVIKESPYVTIDGLYNGESVELPRWFVDEVKDINEKLKEKLTPSDYLQILKGEAMWYRKYSTKESYLKQVRQNPSDEDNPYTSLGRIENLCKKLEEIAQNPDSHKIFDRPHFESVPASGVQFRHQLKYATDILSFTDDHYVISTYTPEDGGTAIRFWDSRTGHIVSNVYFNEGGTDFIMGIHREDGEHAYAFEANAEMNEVFFWGGPISKLTCIVSPSCTQLQTAYKKEGYKETSGNLSALCGWKQGIPSIPYNDTRPSQPWYKSSDAALLEFPIKHKKILTNLGLLSEQELMSLLKEEDRNEISLGEQETITIKGLSGDTQEIDFDALNNRNIVEGNAENTLIEKTKNIIHSLMEQSSALAVVAEYDESTESSHVLCRVPLNEIFVNGISDDFTVFSARNHMGDEDGDIGIFGLVYKGKELLLFPMKGGEIENEGELKRFVNCIDDQNETKPIYGMEVSNYPRKGAVGKNYVGALGMREGYDIIHSYTTQMGRFVDIVMVTGDPTVYRSKQKFTVVRMDTENFSYKVIKQFESSGFILPPIWLPKHQRLLKPISDFCYEYIDAAGKQEEKKANVYLDPAQGYAIVLPDGKYAGSPGCEKFLTFGDGERVIGMQALAPWRNRPGEVLEAIGGKADDIVALKETTKRWLKKQGFDPENMPAEPKLSEFPVAEVTMPELFSEKDTVQFGVKLKATAHGIKKVEVRVDGVLIPQSWDEELNVAAGVEKEVTVEVPLASGQNWIEVTPVDSEGISGDTFRFRTICKEKKPSDLYVVTLGVSDYDDDDLKLQYAAKDAKDIAAAFEKYGTGRKHMLVLTDKEVRDSSVLDKVKAFLTDAKVDDRVILYVAGHGMLDDKLNYYYAPAGFDSERMAETGIPMEALTACLHNTKAHRRLLLLDTCHSGMLGEEGEDKLAASGVQLPHGVRAIQHRGMKVKKAVGALNANQKKRYIENVFSRGSTERGINIIAGAAGAEYAQESSEWNNGVFTCSIIEAIRDAGSDLNGDKKVTVDELQQIATQKVSELTGGAQSSSTVASEGSEGFIIAKP